jgi:hypothetical protein
MYGCETWSLTLRNKHTLRVLRTGRWGEYLDLRGRKWREAGEDYIMRNFITCTLHQILLGWSSQGGQNRWVRYVARLVKMRNAYKTVIRSPKRKGQSEELRIDEKIILEWILRKQGGKLLTGSMLLWIGSSGMSLWIWWWTFGTNKRQGISWLDEWLLASQEGLGSTKSVIVILDEIKTTYRSHSVHNKVLQRISWPNKDEVNKNDWRKLHDQQLHNLCLSVIKFEILEAGERCCTHG